MTTPNQILISHSNRDSETALALCEALEARGSSCWIAPRDISPGEAYASTIVAAIERSQTMLLLLSRSSNRSRHVAQEVELAFDKNVTIVPLILDGAKMSKDLEYFLGASQSVEAAGKPVEELADELARAFDPEGARAADRGRRKGRRAADRASTPRASALGRVAATLLEASGTIARRVRAASAGAGPAGRKRLAAAAVALVILLPALASSSRSARETSPIRSSVPSQAPTVRPTQAIETVATVEVPAALDSESAPAGEPDSTAGSSAPSRVVRDGVTWTRRDSGRELEFSDAKAYCSGLSGDWRLPSARELSELRRAKRSGYDAVRSAGLVWPLEGDEIFNLASSRAGSLIPKRLRKQTLRAHALCVTDG